jgi:hypothetical protein
MRRVLHRFRLRRVMPRIKQDATGRGGRDEKDHRRGDYGGAEHQWREIRPGTPVAMGRSRDAAGRSRLVTCRWLSRCGRRVRLRWPVRLGRPIRPGALMSFGGRIRSHGPRGIRGTEGAVGSPGLLVLISETPAAASTERISLVPRPSAIAADIHTASITPPGKACTATPSHANDGIDYDLSHILDS